MKHLYLFSWVLIGLLFSVSSIKANTIAAVGSTLTPKRSILIFSHADRYTFPSRAMCFDIGLGTVARSGVALEILIEKESFTRVLRQGVPLEVLEVETVRSPFPKSFGNCLDPVEIVVYHLKSREGFEFQLHTFYLAAWEGGHSFYPANREQIETHFSFSQPSEQE